MKLQNYLLYGTIICAFWILLTWMILHLNEGHLDKKQLEDYYEELSKRFRAELNFKLDNLDARNVRQLNELHSEINRLQRKLDALKIATHPSEAVQSRSTSTTASKQNDGGKQLKRVGTSDTIAVLLLACNRESYLKKTLDLLLHLRPSAEAFPIIVSHDCNHQATANQIASYGNQITFIKQPDQSVIDLPAKEKKFEGYYKISRHYKFALNQVFKTMDYKYVIIVEDDLEISSDFFSYFGSTRWLLDKDPSIWCISAWNDNGKDSFVSGNEILYRSDFFPGLGWMLKKDLWEELEPKWPAGYWDDWMRNSEQRKDRVCIRPEVCRTRTFGETGVSKGEFYKTHLKFIKLNSDPVDFSRKDLSYLIKDSYDQSFLSHVYGLPEMEYQQALANYKPELTEIRVTYVGLIQFASFAKRFKIMADSKSGVPRGAYKGIVPFMYNGRRIFMTPPKPS